MVEDYETRPVRVAVIGAGRIGEVHLSNLIRRVHGAVVTGIHDLDAAKAEALAARYRVPAWNSLDELFSRGEPDAVVIGSSSGSHLEHVEQAAAAGLAVLCEKPLALDEFGITRAIAACEQHGVLLQVGFNRRFDPNVCVLREAVASSRLGALRSLRITSRDPKAPSIDYVRHSGGMIMDMSIHDLDLARHLAGEEIVEVVAYGGCLIEPEIGLAGDIDVATIMLRYASGAVCVIENTRETPYGYDQRLEILGSAAALETENLTGPRFVLRSGEGQSAPNPLPFFLERYEAAFAAQLQAFVDAVRDGGAPQVSGADALAAFRLAKAVLTSLQTGTSQRLAA